MIVRKTTTPKGKEVIMKEIYTLKVILENDWRGKSFLIRRIENIPDDAAQSVEYNPEKDETIFTFEYQREI